MRDHVQVADQRPAHPAPRRPGAGAGRAAPVGARAQPRGRRSASGKFAGCARKSRASQRPAASASAEQRRAGRAASAGRGGGRPPPATTSRPSATSTQRRARGGSAPPPSAARDRAGGRSRARGRSRCSRPCAGSRCRRAPWRGSAPAAARGRTRAATGAGPPGTPSGPGPRRRRSPRCGSAGAAVGVRREPLEHEGAGDEQAGVARRQEDLGAHVSLAADASSPAIAATPSGWSSSVKRMSSGSSSVTRLTVWRIPR